MIHTLLNLCVDSIFALWNCIYYLTRSYQNVINVYHFNFFILLLKALALLVLNMTPNMCEMFVKDFRRCHLCCPAIANQNSWGFIMKKHCSCAMERISVTGFVLPFIVFTYFVIRRYVVPTNPLSAYRFLPDTKQNWAWKFL